MISQSNSSFVSFAFNIAIKQEVGTLIVVYSFLPYSGLCFCTLDIIRLLFGLV